MELTNMAAQVCASYLDRKDIKYSTVDGNHILVHYSTSSVANIQITFEFSNNTRDVRIYAYGFARFPEEKLIHAQLACSLSNSQLRWGKFYIDSDNDLMIEIDAIITPSTVGEICYELMRKITDNIDLRKH